LTMPTEPLGLSMNAGFISGRGDESPGLEQQNQRWAQMIQGQLGKPAPSVLAQTRLSNIAANASAPSMESRVMPDGSTLPSANATAEDTYSGDNQLRLRGVLPL
jgi:hypothetical protein